MENINKQRRKFISLSQLGYGPLEFNFTTERTQIHFLGDVLVAVASLDLKVPNKHLSNTLVMLGSVRQGDE